MNILIDNKKIAITNTQIEESVQYAQKAFHEVYEKIDSTQKLAIKTLLRTFGFPFLEKTFNMPIRPPKNADPLTFLIQKILEFTEEALKHAEVAITCQQQADESFTANSLTFNLKGESQGG